MDKPPLHEHRRAVIYCRVSTDEQADKGYSLPTQLEACERYAHDHGFEIVGQFRDDYTGAVPLETRPEGKKAYDLLRNGGADVLIAYRIDRIVRPPEDGDEWDMPVLIRGLAKLGKGIHVCNRGELKTDFASLLIAMLDARKAGEERRDIVERTTRGRNKKAREGKVVGTGKALFGFEKAGDTFVVNEQEAAIIRMIYKWYTDSGMSDKAIAHELSMMRIKTPGEAKGMGPKRTAGVWRHTSVRLILMNEAYTGVYHYGKTIGKGGKGGARPTDQHITVNIPSIIPRATWSAAQERREYNKRMSARNTHNEYLLRGMLKCSCGRSMCAHMAHGKPWYRCSSRGYQQKGLEILCTEKGVNGSIIEDFAWAYALKIITERDKLLPRLKEAQAEALKALEPQQDKLLAILEDLNDCETEAGQVATAMGSIPKEAQATSVVFRQLQRRAAELDKRYAAQCRKRDALQAEIDAAVITDESILNITTFSADSIEGLNDPAFAEKRRWLEYLKIRVEVKDHMATASTMLKVESATIDLNTSRNPER